MICYSDESYNLYRCFCMVLRVHSPSRFKCVSTPAYLLQVIEQPQHAVKCCRCLLIKDLFKAGL